MRRFALVAVVALVGAGAALGFPRQERLDLTLAARSSPGGLYAIDFAVKGGRLVRLDPATLRARPGRAVPVANHLMGWSFSPDRRRLALGDEIGRLRIVDTVRMREAGRIDTEVVGSVLATCWLPPNRLLAVVDSTLVVIDPAARRVLARSALPSTPVAAARTSDGLVLLLPPASGGIGESTLAVADRDGRVRTVPLTEIQSGMDEIDHEAAGLYRQARPGLTVDPAGNRAFVVAADEPVAEIELATLRVSYHALATPVSILGRLHDWLEPRALAKGAAVGPSRTARWLGSEAIAVTGVNDEGSLDAQGRGRQHQQPAGLSVIDTRTWTVRRLDGGASQAVVGTGLLLASAYLWDSTTERSRGMGLSAYGPDGSRRFHVLGAEPLWGVQVVGGRAIVPREEPGGRVSYALVDLAAGRVSAELRPRVELMLLNPDASPWLG